MSKPNPRGAPHPRPAAHTAWTDADWYLGMVGVRGHAYHRHLALPALLELLDVPRGGLLLDLGCGPGVLAPHIARRGIRYTGVDASPVMIAQARRLHARAGTFVTGDARALPSAVTARLHDAVTFLFSLQDMTPLEAVLHEAARALRPGGRVVAVLTHPCFRVPRASGWGHDPARRLTYRRIDRYLTPLTVRGAAGTSTSFHRPLEAYFAALAAAGLAVDALRELAPTPPLMREVRTAVGNPDIPALLAFRARQL